MENIVISHKYQTGDHVFFHLYIPRRQNKQIYLKVGLLIIDSNSSPYVAHILIIILCLYLCNVNKNGERDSQCSRH